MRASRNHAVCAIRRLHTKIQTLPEDHQVSLSILPGGTVVAIANGRAAKVLVERLTADGVSEATKVPVNPLDVQDPRNG